MLSLKLILRQLLRNRNISFFKLLSLVIGFTISFLIFTHISYQFTFDNFHSDGDRIYRIGCLWNNDGDVDDSPIIIAPLAPALVTNIPEIEEYALIKDSGEKVFSVNKNHFSEYSIYADSSFFNFFSFPIIKKSVKNELSSSYRVLISESASKRMFANNEVLGQIIYDSNKKAYQIEGVFADIPLNSHLQFDIVISFQTIRTEKKFYTGWDGGDSFTGYIKTISDVNITDIESKIPNVVSKYFDTSEDETSNNTETYYFQELKGVNIRHDIYKKNILIILAAVGGIIIIISVLNYVLLSLSSFHKNLPKLGIQQCFGANKNQIQSMVAKEHVGFIAFSVLISLILLVPVSKFTNHYLNWNNSIDFNSYTSFSIGVIICLGLILSVGLPILKLYKLKFQLLNVKVNSKIESKGKKILLTMQMTGVIILLIMLLFVFRQLQYIENIDMGYRTKGLAYIELRGDEARKNCTKLIEELKKQSFVNDVSASTALLLYWLSGNSYTIPSQKDRYRISRFLQVDREFFKTLEMEIVDGKDFSAFSESDQQIVLINKKLADQLNWDNPVGKTIFKNEEDKAFKIVGVTSDFIMSSARVEKMPCIFYKLPQQDIPQYASYLTINLNRKISSHQIEDLQNLLTSVSPDYPLNLSFYDVRLAQRYETERQLKKSISLFSFLAVILAIISLVGYISHEINLRTKEIGIRKVSGAKTYEIIRMLNKDFIKWVGIAFIIACPIAWYAMDKWLENFAYKTELSWWIFALAGLIAMAIALLTVSIQSWRAATRNPVESLRYE